MKRVLLTLISVFMISGLSALAPQSFKYQTVFRNGNGTTVLANKDIAFRMTLLAGSKSDPAAGVDQENRTIPHAMYNNEVGNIDFWVKHIVTSAGSIRVLSIIESSLHIPAIDTSRRNFYGYFPVRDEHIYGFELSTKLKS